MPRNTRHLASEWLRLSPRRGRETGAERSRQLEGTWLLWERLRTFDARHAIEVDIALAVGLFLLCSGWLFETGGVVNVWFVAALISPLVFRRRAPMAVFLTISAVGLLQWAVSVPLLADASLLVALYTVAAECEWRQVVLAAAILEVGIVLATVRWSPTGNDTKSIIFLNGMAFTALLAGVVVRALRSQLDWLTERAERFELERDQQASLAAAAERARIAREMHDVVSHNLQVMVTLADAATAAQNSDSERAAEAMREVSSTGRQALTDMRRMLGVLREEPSPAASNGGADGVATGMADDAAATNTLLASEGLAPQPGLAELDGLVERVHSTGLLVTLERTGRPFELTGAAQLTVYRIVQEALTNVLKHAPAPSRVDVRLEYDEPDVTVRVHEDGRGRLGDRASVPAGVPAAGSTSRRAPAAPRGGNGSGVGSGHGLSGMAERAAAFGGALEAGPVREGGWDVVTTLRDCKAQSLS